MEGGENPSEKPARCYVAVNGITDSGGGTGAGLFTYSDPAQYPQCASHIYDCPQSRPHPMNHKGVHHNTFITRKMVFKGHAIPNLHPR